MISFLFCRWSDSIFVAVLPVDQKKKLGFALAAFAYTINRCIFDTQHFDYFNSLPMISSSNKMPSQFLEFRWDFLSLYKV